MLAQITRVVCLFCPVLMLAVACDSASGERPVPTVERPAPTVPPGWTFTFPDGDPSAGRTLFFEHLACSSCHHLYVPGVLSKPGYPSNAPGYGATGPDLDGYDVLPKEYLAESIMSAHRYVAAPGYAIDERGPTMGNYNHLLLVQELIDLVAFLRTPR